LRPPNNTSLFDIYIIYRKKQPHTKALLLSVAVSYIDILFSYTPVAIPIYLLLVLSVYLFPALFEDWLEDWFLAEFELVFE